MDIQAVAFDIDGTLYPSRPLYIRALPRAIGRATFLYHFAKIRRTIRRIRPIDDFFTLQTELLVKSMNRSLTTAAAEQLINVWNNTILDRLYRTVELYPFVHECIDGLKNAGLKLGALTDSEPLRKLSYFALDNVFDCIVSSEQVGYLKPNPEPFNHLAECLDVKPAQIVYIGNNYEYDVLGALNVGMKAIHRARAPAKNSRADFTFSDYRDLMRELVDYVRC